MPESTTTGVMPEGNAEGQECGTIDKVFAYSREIVLAVVIVIGLLGVFAYADYTQQKAETAAVDDIYKSMQDSHGKDKVLAEKMAEVSKKHGDTQAIYYSLMLETQALVEQKKYDYAINAAQIFLGKFPNHYFAGQMKLTLGRVYMLKGEYTKARDMLKGVTQSNLEGEARLDAAVCLVHMARPHFGKDPDQYKRLLSQAEDELIRAEKQAPTSAYGYSTIYKAAVFNRAIVKDMLANPTVLPPEPRMMSGKAAEALKKAKEELEKKAGKNSAADKTGVMVVKPEEKVAGTAKNAVKEGDVKKADRADEPAKSASNTDK